MTTIRLPPTLSACFSKLSVEYNVDLYLPERKQRMTYGRVAHSTRLVGDVYVPVYEWYLYCHHLPEQPVDAVFIRLDSHVQTIEHRYKGERYFETLDHRYVSYGCMFIMKQRHLDAGVLSRLRRMSKILRHSSDQLSKYVTRMSSVPVVVSCNYDREEAVYYFRATTPELLYDFHFPPCEEPDTTGFRVILTLIRMAKTRALATRALHDDNRVVAGAVGPTLAEQRSDQHEANAVVAGKQVGCTLLNSGVYASRRIHLVGVKPKWLRMYVRDEKYYLGALRGELFFTKAPKTDKQLAQLFNANYKQISEYFNINNCVGRPRHHHHHDDESRFYGPREDVEEKLADDDYEYQTTQYARKYGLPDDDDVSQCASTVHGESDFEDDDYRDHRGDSWLEVDCENAEAAYLLAGYSGS